MKFERLIKGLEEERQEWEDWPQGRKLELIISYLRAAKQLREDVEACTDKMVDSGYLNPDDEDDRNPLLWLRETIKKYDEATKV